MELMKCECDVLKYGGGPDQFAGTWGKEDGVKGILGGCDGFVEPGAAEMAPQALQSIDWWGCTMSNPNVECHLFEEDLEEVGPDGLVDLRQGGYCESTELKRWDLSVGGWEGGDEVAVDHFLELRR